MCSKDAANNNLVSIANLFKQEIRFSCDRGTTFFFLEMQWDCLLCKGKFSFTWGIVLLAKMNGLHPMGKNKSNFFMIVKKQQNKLS